MNNEDIEALLVKLSNLESAQKDVASDITSVKNSIEQEKQDVKLAYENNMRALDTLNTQIKKFEKNNKIDEKKPAKTAKYSGLALKIVAGIVISCLATVGAIDLISKLKDNKEKDTTSGKKSSSQDATDPVDNQETLNLNFDINNPETVLAIANKFKQRGDAVGYVIEDEAWADIVYIKNYKPSMYGKYSSLDEADIAIQEYINAWMKPFQDSVHDPSKLVPKSYEEMGLGDLYLDPLDSEPIAKEEQYLYAQADAIINSGAKSSAAHDAAEAGFRRILDYTTGNFDEHGQKIIDDGMSSAASVTQNQLVNLNYNMVGLIDAKMSVTSTHKDGLVVTSNYDELATGTLFDDEGRIISENAPIFIDENGVINSEGRGRRMGQIPYALKLIRDVVAIAQNNEYKECINASKKANPTSSEIDKLNYEFIGAQYAAMLEEQETSRGRIA